MMWKRRSIPAISSEETNPVMKHLLSLILLSLCFLSCERDFIGDHEGNSSANGKVRVTFNIAGIEQIPFENTSSRAGERLYTRLTIAIFQGDTKVKNVSQTMDDATLGSISMDIAPGTYQIVAIAHNGLGNCTISSPDKITFANNKMTDTFYHYGSIDVTASCTSSLILKRSVAMFRMIVTDEIPKEVAQMKFYYTGGSSTFNAVTGFGCVQSKQTEIINVNEAKADASGTVFEVYSFPHEPSDLLNIKVAALDAVGNTIAETAYDNIPIQQNVVTQYTTQFFDITPTINLSAIASVENGGQWQSTIEL